MQKILHSAQIQLADAATLQKQQITSHELMERASEGFLSLFGKLPFDGAIPICILCGTGNNGGDGLAIARLLAESSYDVSVLIYRSGRRESRDFLANLALLKGGAVPIREWSGGNLPRIQEAVVIDALVGIGLNKPLEGELLRLVDFVNSLNKYVVAVDIPTGMPVDGPFTGQEAILKATAVFTFQQPKLSFFFPESVRAMSYFKVIDIGLDEGYIQALPSIYAMIEASDIAKSYRKRTDFSHKGTFGKALIIAGDTHTLGAALLCAEACLHAGAGLTTACIAEESRAALNIRCPEVMFLGEEELEKRWDEFTVVGVGPGLGDRSKLLRKLLAFENKPMLLDADALNYLALHSEVLSAVPEATILTPHMKEFDRLFGASDSWWERLQLARKKAREYHLIIVLKNRYTFIVLPNGEVRINATGNPAMASGGMGDVLTGVITAFLAQGYSSEEAAVLGVYVHGKAGDALASEGMAVVSASQVIARVPFILGEFHGC